MGPTRILTAAVLFAALSAAASAQSTPDAARRCITEPPGDRAIALCREAVRLDPHSARAQLDLATTLDRAGKSDEALRAYRRYVELDPTEPRAHELVGWLLLQKNHPAEALVEFRTGQRLAPQRGSAYHGAGVALVALNRREEALRSFQEATRLTPDDAAVWGEAASAAADLGRSADALSSWDQAMRADPSFFDRRPNERKRWEALVTKAPSRALIIPTPPASANVAREAATRDATQRDVTPAQTAPRAAATSGLLAKHAGPDASGSGFVVTADGYVVTNRHVVNGCQSISVRVDSASAFKAQIIALHARDDLAVIRADITFDATASFRAGAPIRPGDDVVAVGFPLAGLLADEASVSTGSVNALAGIHNDPAILQMSAPVQQGSSGGPLFDASGNVVGVVVTKLNARIVAEETGDLPQNVNFALKGEIARTFLEELAIRYRTAPSTTRLGNADVGDIGRRVTVMVECYR